MTLNADVGWCEMSMLVRQVMLQNTLPEKDADVPQRPKRTHTVNASCVILSNSYRKFADDKGCCRTKAISPSWSKASVTQHMFLFLEQYTLKKNRMSLTLCVDWLGGGAFLLKSASEMASHGSASSFRMVNRGLSHRFLESGASNLNTNASKLQATDQMTGNFKKRLNWMVLLLVRQTYPKGKTCNSTAYISTLLHVLGVLLRSVSVGVPRWTHFIWCQTVHLVKKNPKWVWLVFESLTPF